MGFLITLSCWITQSKSDMTFSCNLIWTIPYQ